MYLSSVGVAKAVEHMLPSEINYLGSSPTIRIFLYVAEATHNSHKSQTSMPPVGFETTMSAGEAPYSARPLEQAKYLTFLTYSMEQSPS
jgi:hypothetical protein